MIKNNSPADAHPRQDGAGPPNLIARLCRPGPKRILSLDGGGTRGVVSLAFLERIEAELCGTDPDGRLCDHFDLIGGTSTGAIIASALSLGWSVAKLRQVYDDFASSVFRRRWYRLSPLVSRYDAGALELLLGKHFGKGRDGNDLLLGSAELRTGLAIVTKRVDTGSPWVVSNLPSAPFYADRGGSNGNWRIPLCNLIRASTAAPTFFRSVDLPLGPRADGTVEFGRFVDGGASPYNNPALRLLELARLRCFGLNWNATKDDLLIVSVGTGRFRSRQTAPRSPVRTSGVWQNSLVGLPVFLQAINVLQSVIGDGMTQTLRSLQILGHCPQPVQIDSEVGTMNGEILGREPLFTFLRYDIDLDKVNTMASRETLLLRRLDAPEMMTRLWSLGCAAAALDVKAEHFTHGA